MAGYVLASVGGRILIYMGFELFDLKLIFVPGFPFVGCRVLLT